MLSQVLLRAQSHNLLISSPLHLSNRVQLIQAQLREAHIVLLRLVLRTTTQQDTTLNNIPLETKQTPSLNHNLVQLRVRHIRHLCLQVLPLKPLNQMHSTLVAQTTRGLLNHHLPFRISEGLETLQKLRNNVHSGEQQENTTI